MAIITLRPDASNPGGGLGSVEDPFTRYRDIGTPDPGDIVEVLDDFGYNEATPVNDPHWKVVNVADLTIRRARNGSRPGIVRTTAHILTSQSQWQEIDPEPTTEPDNSGYETGSRTYDRDGTIFNANGTAKFLKPGSGVWHLDTSVLAGRQANMVQYRTEGYLRSIWTPATFKMQGWNGIGASKQWLGTGTEANSVGLDKPFDYDNGSGPRSGLMQRFLSREGQWQSNPTIGICVYSAPNINPVDHFEYIYLYTDNPTLKFTNCQDLLIDGIEIGTAGRPIEWATNGNVTIRNTLRRVIIRDFGQFQFATANTYQGGLSGIGGGAGFGSIWFNDNYPGADNYSDGTKPWLEPKVEGCLFEYGAAGSQVKGWIRNALFKRNRWKLCGLMNSFGGAISAGEAYADYDEFNQFIDNIVEYCSTGAFWPGDAYALDIDGNASCWAVLGNFFKTCYGGVSMSGDRRGNVAVGNRIVDCVKCLDVAAGPDNGEQESTGDLNTLVPTDPSSWGENGGVENWDHETSWGIQIGRDFAYEPVGASDDPRAPGWTRNLDQRFRNNNIVAPANNTNVIGIEIGNFDDDYRHGPWCDVPLISKNNSGDFHSANWDFRTGADGFTALNGTDPTASGGILTYSASGNSNQNLNSPVIARPVNGGDHRIVSLRIRRTAGSGWNGTLRWSRVADGGFNSNTLQVSEPAGIDSGFVTVVWDFAGHGGTPDWEDDATADDEVDQLRWKLIPDGDATTVFEIECVAVADEAVSGQSWKNENPVAFGQVQRRVPYADPSVSVILEDNNFDNVLPANRYVDRSLNDIESSITQTHTTLESKLDSRFRLTADSPEALKTGGQVLDSVVEGGWTQFGGERDGKGIYRHGGQQVGALTAVPVAAQRRRLIELDGRFDTVARRYPRPRLWAPISKPGYAYIDNAAQEGNLHLALSSPDAWDEYDPAAGKAYMKVSTASVGPTFVYDFDPVRNVFGNATNPADAIFAAALMRFEGNILVSLTEVGALNSPASFGIAAQNFRFAAADSTFFSRPHTVNPRTFGVAVWAQASGPANVRQLYAVVEFDEAGNVVDLVDGDIVQPYPGAPPYETDGGLPVEGTIDLIASGGSYGLYGWFYAQSPYNEMPPGFSNSKQLAEQAREVFAGWRIGDKDVPPEWYEGEMD